MSVVIKFVTSDTGKTYVAHDTNTAGQWWNVVGVAYETFDATNKQDGEYDIVLTETPASSGVYLDSATMTDGDHDITINRRTGSASPYSYEQKSDTETVRVVSGVETSQLGMTADILADTDDIQTKLPAGGANMHAAGAAVAKSPATLDWSLDVSNKPTIGTSNLDEAGVRTAVGLATNNLDTQLGDIPTNTELALRTKLTADYADKTTLDAVALEVAGINGSSVLSAADIRDAVGLAEADLDDQLGALPTAAAIAAAVWGYTTRTLSSFGTLVASIWEYTTRTLSSGGVPLALGPSAYTNARLIPVKVFKNGTAPMCARILASDGGNAQKADVTSITYTIYAVDEEYSGTHPDTWVAVTGHTDVALTVSEVMYNTLQSDYIATNYNFRHTPVVSTNPAFEHIGVPYTVEYKFVMADGSPTVTSRFAITVI